ncbi:hypothetical protein P4U65_13940 [Bacillus pacificus]|nr:hypothetical protein [Bacillus thuringiensis]MED1301649.1 hypothetical protein [Bacillus pacificus]
MIVETSGELNTELFAETFIRIVRAEREMKRESKLTHDESKKTPKTKSPSNSKE